MADNNKILGPSGRPIDISESQAISLEETLFNLRVQRADMEGRASRDATKEIDKKIKLTQQQLNIEKDLIKVGKDYLGDLRIRKQAEDEYNKIVKQLNKELKDCNLSEKERLALIDKLTEKIREQNTKFFDASKVINSLGDAIKGLIGKLIGVGTLIAIFDRAQMGRRFDVTTSGIGGMTNMGGRSGTTFDVLKYTAYGQMFGKSPQESLQYADTLAKRGFVTGNTRGDFSDLLNIAKTGIAVQSKFGVSEDAMAKVMHVLTFNLGMSSDKLASAFVKLSKNIEETNMNMPEFTSYFADLAPEFAKYGANVDDAVGIVRKFSDSLVKGTININNFTSAFASRNEASTSDQLGFYMLSRRYGIRMPGLNIPAGATMMDIAGKTREWVQQNPVQSLQSAVQLVDRLTGGMSKTPQGGAEAIRQFSSLFPDVAALMSKVPLKEQSNIIGMARSGNLTQGMLDKITSADKAQSDKFLQDQSLAFAATATTAELLKNVIAGTATFHVTDMAERSVESVGKWLGIIDEQKNVSGWRQWGKTYAEALSNPNSPYYTSVPGMVGGAPQTLLPPQEVVVTVKADKGLVAKTEKKNKGAPRNTN